MREVRASGDAAAANEFDWFCVPDRENPDNFGLRCGAPLTHSLTRVPQI